MTTSMALDLLHGALMNTFWVCLPLLLVGLVVGVLISVGQILTSIQDTSVSTVPRLACFLIAALVWLPWLLHRLMTYTTTLFSDFSRFAH